MEIGSGGFAGMLRREIAARNREYARGRAHAESYGGEPVVVYEPDSIAGVERHGNFYAPAYEAIVARKDWAKRLNKVHTGRKDLPRAESGRKWRELDSSMSSDALLMNCFCWAPAARSEAGIDAIGSLLGVHDAGLPEFGWKAKVPLKSGLFDRTEVDMRWGDLLVEAKLTEADFQTRKAAVVESYRDFDAVFERELLSRVEVLTARRRQAVEFAEDFTQEWEDTAGVAPEEAGAISAEFHAGLVAEAEERAPREARYRGYQLIRNVLAAHAAGARFCVICDERRPDLKEAWFRVMAAVKSAEMRTRCLVLTWQELAGVAPAGLREFLERKYGIVGGSLHRG